MCYQYIVAYTCLRPTCTFTQTSFSTHCQILDRDNIQGQCGSIIYGGVRRMSYACCNCSGLSTPVLSSMVVRQSGSDKWRNYPNQAEPTNRGRVQLTHLDMQRRWRQNSQLYEREPGMPQEVRDMTAQDWTRYLRLYGLKTTTKKS